jgi:predicted nucleic-acid-binding Zn-ribbon protein
MKPCVKCGGTSFGEGVTRGEGNIIPAKKIFSLGSSLLFTICLDCGEVNSIRACQPEKFKSK